MQWISIKDNFPEDPTKTVVGLDHKNEILYFVRYDKNDGWFDDDGAYDNKNFITHWLELPSLPNE